jgi:predicted ferric reductase
MADAEETLSRASAPMTLLDLCSYLGLAAVATVAVNLLLGVLMALRYSPLRLWPHRRIDIFALHRWTAYLALVLAVLHPVVLLFLRSPQFSLLQIMWPLHSYLQPRLNTTGAVALYLLGIVLLSSLWRTSMSRKLWRNLHWLVYPAALLMLIHSFLTDPELKDGHPDLLDGGKVFIGITAAVILAAGIFRFVVRRRGFRPLLSDENSARIES